MDTMDRNNLLMAAAEGAAIAIADESIYEPCPARPNNGESSKIANITVVRTSSLSSSNFMLTKSVLYYSMFVYQPLTGLYVDVRTVSYRALYLMI